MIEVNCLYCRKCLLVAEARTRSQVGDMNSESQHEMHVCLKMLREAMERIGPIAQLDRAQVSET